MQRFLNNFLCAWALLLFTGILSGCSVVKTNISRDDYLKGMIYYYLPESLVKITSTIKVKIYYDETGNTLTDSNRIEEQSFSVKTETIADERELLVLKYKSNIFMSDELKYEVNNKGLLGSVTVTTDDKTAAIINTIISPFAKVSKRELYETRGFGTRYIIKEYTSNFSIRVSDIIGQEKLVDWQVPLFYKGEKGKNKSINASFKIKIAGNRCNKTDIKSISNTKNDHIDGILTRPLRNADLQVSTDLVTGRQETCSFWITIVDPNILINIPIKRTVFAKRENKIILEDGIIKSIEITNPSSFLGFVSIPIDIAKAIISIPGQLLTFK